MTFYKYKSKDYAEGQLLSWIWTGTTSIQLKSWHGARFPSVSGGEYFVWTLEIRSGSTVTSKERVLVTGRSTDTLTVTRSFDSDTAIAFSADDYFCLHVNSAILTDLQTEMDLKLAAAGWLRTALTAWRSYYTNGSGAETALAFGTSWQVLTSNWASSAPSWWSPALDINGQTTETTLDPDADFIAIYDASASANRKMLTKYIAKVATNAEAHTGSATDRYINPAQLKTYFGGAPVWGSGLQVAFSGTETSTTNTSLTKKYEGTIHRTGTYRITFELKGTWGASSIGQIYKNGVAFGTSQSTTNTSYDSFSEDLAFTASDLIQLYIRSGSWPTAYADSLKVEHWMDLFTFTTY